MTKLSPWIIGMTESRISISRPCTRSLIRPSCGNRFSAMLRWAIILRREMMAAWKRLISGGIAWVCKIPSMRYRTTIPADCDSMCTSLARVSMASTKSSFTNRTTDASWACSPSSLPSASIFSSNSISASSSDLEAISPSTVSLPTPRCLLTNLAISSFSATSGTTASPVAADASSSAYRSRGLLVATNNCPPSRLTGNSACR